jgi:arylsulfatase B
LFSKTSIIRNYQYSELNDGSNDSWAISNGAYKLIVNDTGNQELYNIVLDSYEQNNLLSGVLSPIEENAKSDLEAELNNIRQ